MISPEHTSDVLFSAYTFIQTPASIQIHTYLHIHTHTEVNTKHIFTKPQAIKFTHSQLMHTHIATHI